MEKALVSHLKRTMDKVLGIHLFVKVPRPGDSEVTFSVFASSCHLLFVSSISLTLIYPIELYV